MNEQIEKLALQAGINFGNFESVTVDVDDVKKFAELLLMECITICNNTNGASYLNGVYAGRQIKQHFGVEE